MQCNTVDHTTIQTLLQFGMLSRQADRQIGRQADRQTNRQTDRQRDVYARMDTVVSCILMSCHVLRCLAACLSHNVRRVETVADGLLEEIGLRVDGAKLSLFMTVQFFGT